MKNKKIFTKKWFLNFILVCLTWGATMPIAAAKDPFRTSNVRPISNQTEIAFNALFKEGNYPKATQYLKQAEQSDRNDPLITAMEAALSYTTRNWSQVNVYAKQTQTRAQALVSKDKLRGNLYLGVGHFLEGAYLFQTKGALAALGKVPTATSYMDKAKKENAKDPEFNLINGYIDLLLAVNLPFTDPEDAIAKFQTNAAPSYLVNRGIALAYRDLVQLPKALQYANMALASTPNQPELFYLKAQILYMQGNRETNKQLRVNLYQQANQNFDRAYTMRSQLPPIIVHDLTRERDKSKRKYNEILSGQK